MKFIYVLFLLSCFISCKTETKNRNSKAEDIIDKTIEVSGVEILDTSKVSFKFRDFYYQAERNNGEFQLIRKRIDSSGIVLDELSNESFQRYIDGIEVKVADSMAIKYSNSVNSVHYFSTLPYGLDDEAVKLNYLDSVDIKDNSYHKIQVTFSEEGGGTDFEDVFIYWINRETFFIDYLAYEFHVNGGGVRFREAYNERFVSGVRFVDYTNYKPIGDDLKLLNIDSEFKNNKLELLSKIELDSIEIN